MVLPTSLPATYILSSFSSETPTRSPKTDLFPRLHSSHSKLCAQLYYTHSPNPNYAPIPPIHTSRANSKKISFTTQFPADLNSNADITSHDAKMAAAGGKLGLVSGGGTVLRYVDFAPGYDTLT